MKALDNPNNPVCIVSHPAAPVALWNGIHGNAKVIAGEPYAITSDGVKHAL